MTVQQQQLHNEVVTTYVHLACLAWRRLLAREIQQEVGVRILLDCKRGLEKYGYSFALVKDNGVIARKETSNA